MARVWQFTWFYDIEKSAVNQYLIDHKPKCVVYVQGGFELCPETKKAHLQGQFILESNGNMTKDRNVVFAMTGVKCHIEKVVSTLAMTRYNAKDGQVIVIGEYPDLRSDEFDEAAALVLAGKTKEVKKSILIKYPGGISNLEKVFYEPMKDLSIPSGCKVGIWIHGKPETFKSYRARKLFSDLALYDKSLDGLWDYYAKEPVVLLDDVTAHTMTWLFDKLLRWADRYAFPARVSYKGSPIIRPRYVIVTSNISLEDLYPCLHERDKYLAMRRRFADLNTDTGEWSHLRTEVRELPPADVIPANFNSV